MSSLLLHKRVYNKHSWRLQKLLLFLILLFLPTQLGKHFFFPFSFISGIRSDYYTPTLFFTDVLIIIFFAATLLDKNKFAHRQGVSHKRYKEKFFLVLIATYLLFSSFFIAENHYVALYKLIKIVEMCMFGYAIIRTRPSYKFIAIGLSIPVFYSSCIALTQFFLQRSIGGYFWFLGERTFYSSTPSIAAASLDGALYLRPYGTFPHPNVLGGFLAVVFPYLLLFLKLKKNTVSVFLKTWLIMCISIGIVALVFTFSRVSWIVGLLGFSTVMVYKKSIWKFFNRSNIPIKIFYTLSLFSFILPPVLIILPYTISQNLQERAELIISAFTLILFSPLTGVGLNNSILQQRPVLSSGWSLLAFQPIHNVYLLVLAETGIIGFLLFLTCILLLYRSFIKKKNMVVFSFIGLLLLGFFDHYLVTLQQGMLLVTLLSSLAFLKEKPYTDNTKIYEKTPS